MTKNFDGIRLGTVFLLKMDDRDNLPFEMRWAKRWIVVKLISECKIQVRSQELKRDIVISRINEEMYISKSGLSSNFIFHRTSERQLILPSKLVYHRKTTSVMVDEYTAERFLIDHTGTNFRDIVNDAIYRLTQNKIDSMAQEVRELYKEKTGRYPDYLPVFNSILSPDLLFLKELKKAFRGEVDMDQMRWIAFKADDLLTEYI